MSYWTDNFETKINFDTLKNDIVTDVCIIGAGLTGLSCGYYLTKNSLKVTIIDQEEICSKTSGSTTAKITSQHGLFYDYLQKSYGVNFSKDYLQVNENAIQNIKNIVETEKIKCDMCNSSSFVFCDKQDEIKLFTQEFSALNRIKNDIKINDFTLNIKFHKHLDIPLKNYGGIEFTNQAMFNPRKYAFGLAESILNTGANIFQNTKALNIKYKNNLYTVETNKKTITSKYVILATHFPIKNFPGMYFFKMYQDISYALAVKTSDNVFDGYYINHSSPTISFRKVYEKTGENVVLISGNGHKVGRTNNDIDSYKFLEDTASKMFKNYEVISRWSTQDCISMDKLPFIGNFSKLMPNFFVATGFKKWGMTLSNISANLICDKILGNKNEFEYLFKPSRVKLLKNHKSYGEHFKETIYSIGLNKLKLPDDTVKDIKEGTGKIVLFHGKKVGVYKDKNGISYLVNPICTHLKCELQFNQTDKTWDCPCHGSRFSYKGDVLNNPAIYNLNNN